MTDPIDEFEETSASYGVDAHISVRVDDVENPNRLDVYIPVEGAEVHVGTIHGNQARITAAAILGKAESNVDMEKRFKLDLAVPTANEISEYLSMNWSWSMIAEEFLDQARDAFPQYSSRLNEVMPTAAMIADHYSTSRHYDEQARCVEVRAMMCRHLLAGIL